MAKHTPGPWRVGEIQASSINKRLMHSIEGPEMVGDYETWGFNEADAHLIAAAPDLLAACKATREWLRNGKWGGVAGVDQVLSEAITKAEGTS